MLPAWPLPDWTRVGCLDLSRFAQIQKAHCTSLEDYRDVDSKPEYSIAGGTLKYRVASLSNKDRLRWNLG